MYNKISYIALDTQANSALHSQPRNVRCVKENVHPGRNIRGCAQSVLTVRVHKSTKLQGIAEVFLHCQAAEFEVRRYYFILFRVMLENECSGRNLYQWPEISGTPIACIFFWKFVSSITYVGRKVRSTSLRFHGYGILLWSQNVHLPDSLKLIKYFVPHHRYVCLQLRNFRSILMLI